MAILREVLTLFVFSALVCLCVVQAESDDEEDKELEQRLEGILSKQKSAAGRQNVSQSQLPRHHSLFFACVAFLETHGHSLALIETNRCAVWGAASSGADLRRATRSLLPSGCRCLRRRWAIHFLSAFRHL